MKSTKKLQKAPASLELNLTSMIDVIFLLLIFFVFTSDFKEPEKRLPTNLSGAGAVATTVETLTQEERDLGKITVRIAVNAENETVWTVDGRRVESLAAVEETLTKLREIDPNVPAIVAPERNVPIESALDVYDVARRVGLGKIKLAASPEALARVSN